MLNSSEPYLRDLSYRGFVEGLTIKNKSSGTPLCHYFGGIPYALPPTGLFRWRKPRPLPSCFRYGTRANPGRYVGGTGVCPQPGFGKEVDESRWEEDCLQCNVWMPVGEAEGGKGWPVVFYIHGGFLQFGSPNGSNLSSLLSETACKCIFVMPAYRLNLFGFLASRELCLDSESPELAPNAGFWDQRLALEWTLKNISYFGGNASNITIAGYSAGAHSVFHQLAYDLGVPDSKSVVKRAIMWSNGPGLQPKSLMEAQEQFDELLYSLKIKKNLSSLEKLAKLRSLDPKTLVKASLGLKYHQFRAVTDSSFVRPSLFQEIDNGAFARQMKRRGVKLMIGECRDEHFVYGTWRPPKNSFADLFKRLQADYPRVACEALMDYYYPNGRLPDDCEDWIDAFGRIYADIQIHALERGLVNALVQHEAGDLIFRYRVEWRAKCVDERVPEKWGVTHGTDMAIWFWGNGSVLNDAEKTIVKHAFHKQLAKYVNGEELDWGTTEPLHLRRLTPKGIIKCGKDENLEKGLEIWRILQRVGATSGLMGAKL